MGDGQYSMKYRHEAAGRGLQFIYRHSFEDENFLNWAGDYLWCFYCVSETSEDAGLRNVASQMGTESARRWFAGETALPELAAAGEAAYYVSMVDAARRFGIRDRRLSEHVHRGSRRFTAREYLGFDPLQEAPPGDLPYDCSECGGASARACSQCENCGQALRFRSRYDVWCDALVLS